MEPEVQKGLLADLIARIAVAAGVASLVAACAYRLYVELRPAVERLLWVLRF